MNNRKLMFPFVLIIALLANFSPIAIRNSDASPATVYIRADGSIEPSTAPISSFDNTTYFLNGNIYEGIVIQRSNTVLDGVGYRLQNVVGNGVDMTNVSNVTVKNTVITGNDWDGIFLEGSWNNSILGNDIYSNNYMGISLSNSWNNSISRNSIRLNGYHAIDFWQSSNNCILENNIVSNSHGIWDTYGSNNEIKENSIEGSNGYGIILISTGLYFSNDIIEKNNITSNQFGIISDGSFGNKVTKNLISRNQYGVSLDYCFAANQIFHNTFLENTNQTRIIPAGSYSGSWDDSYPSGGNYWSDHSNVDLLGGVYQNETGEDGIADGPYVIDSNNTDNYPLADDWTRDDSLPTIEAISQNPESTSIMDNDKVFVSANISDFESPIRAAMLFYSTNDGATWMNQTMFFNQTTGVYETTIPEQAIRTLVRYEILAWDYAGNCRIENNNAQYFLYEVVPEFQSIGFILLLFAASSSVAVISKKASVRWKKRRETIKWVSWSSLFLLLVVLF